MTPDAEPHATAPEPTPTPAALPPPDSTPDDSAPQEAVVQTKPAREAPRAPPHERITWILLGLIAALALAVRLREPLSSPIIGAEDPYLHMERGWNLLQGTGSTDYPRGFVVLMAGVALLGQDVAYNIVRFAPPFLGVAAVLTTFLLCHRRLEPAGALAAALFVALMPEYITRTTLFFPTAFDLAVLPVLLWATLESLAGNRRAMLLGAGVALFLVATHPWALALALPPIALYALVRFVRGRGLRAWVSAPTVTGAALAAGLLILPNPLGMDPTAARNRFLGLLADPTTILPLPLYVDLGAMVTVPILVLAGLGGASLLLRRNPLAALALFWTLLILPLVLVDWFHVWYLPHRSVAYLSIGLAVLGGVAVSEAVRLMKDAPPRTRRGAAAALLLVLAIATLPASLATPHWYRIYDEDDQRAWEDLEAHDASLVVTTSWQSRAGYRGTTGEPAVFNPVFFRDEKVREYELRQRPDLVVLVDEHATRDGLPTDFLHDWHEIGRWGDTTAYAREAP